MEMEEESKKFLTINTHKRLFQYNRLVFGVASAPAVWQQAMDQILEGIPHVQCILDDMIISGTTDQEHLDNLEEVFSRLSKHSLRTNSSKCEFFKEGIEFCGHEISKLGLHKSQQKVNAVINAPRPGNVSQIDKEALALVWGVQKFHTYIFARHFTLLTDHKPLTAIFSPTKAIQATTAARLQRYALFLSGFDYEIVHRSSTQHCNADGLSRLPLATTEDEENQFVDSVEAFHVSQFSMLHVTCQHVRKATQRDSRNPRPSV
ncbi:Retrovirus-related Pol poly [Paramuricea clavata]|uniref:Retrovirus-related Pol poly n=1 Tax=Paramuricea clavata TaxID=317549 RepID=A0A7D9IL37_PARCT|nr:Retrovirus-related Pol poly [Paramuricea clavata]